MMRHNTVRLLCAALILCCLLASAVGQAPPRFEDFPAALFKGRTAPVRLAGRGEKMFRSRLRWAVKNQRVNFAGRLILTGWGCGTSCYMFALIDAKTGRVYFPGFSVHFGGVDGEPLEFRPGSRLLIVRGARNEEGGGVYFYTWTGAELKLIRAEEAPGE